MCSGAIPCPVSATVNSAEPSSAVSDHPDVRARFSMLDGIVDQIGDHAVDFLQFAFQTGVRLNVHPDVMITGPRGQTSLLCDFRDDGGDGDDLGLLCDHGGRLDA